MSATVTTYDGHSYEVSDEVALSINTAMAENWQHISIPELDMILAIKDIRRMDNVPNSTKKLPKNRQDFHPPVSHDCVVVNGEGKVIRSYKLGGFYSDEETAKRQKENKVKYLAKWDKERLEQERLVEEKRGARELFA